MTSIARLFCSTALVLAFAPQSAIAEITADDVWRNQLDYLAALGGDLDMTTSRSGNTLTASEGSLTFQFPLELGSLELTFPGLDMIENDDGTVTLEYSRPMIYGFSVDISSQGSFGGKIDFTLDGYSTIASGEPGDVTYTWSVDRMAFLLRDVTMRASDPSKPAPQNPMITAHGSFLDMSGTARIKIGELVTIDSNTNLGKQTISFGAGADEGRLTFTGGADSVATTGQISLPRNGMDIMNMAAALREGLAVSGTSQTIGYYTDQRTETNGKVISSQTSRNREQSVEYEFDQAGLRVKAAVLDADIEAFPGEALPFLVKFQMKKAEGSMNLPLSASSELQDVVYNFSLEGLTMAEEMWALFDPQQTLPRDPMTVAVDLSAKILNKVDWLDFLTVKAVFDSGEVPVELHELTLNDLRVDMAGAQLTGSGAGTFDNSDLASMGGFPKPTGVIDLALKGGNGLLDNLVAMGLLSDEDAMGARMATAVFTAPDLDAGEDALKSRLEMTAEGHILANGQRLQ